MRIGEVGVAKGMIVRVGQFCQGIVKKGDVVHVERWKWMDGLGWRSIAKIGDANLPCEETWRDGIKEGEIISEGGLDWPTLGYVSALVIALL
ncbi:hypothetical protein A0H81_11008 [Grifola frondosa]|uniref:Uncharacterized protein n=1 Tax=Grifola frondosa TaxID=5627 RepID=A0A1C7LW19_GRIFR|nr:hypothetical protein A0H81_11008 [Grifola frondosa]